MYRLVAFSGAGISRESGIPTFEEMDVRDYLTRRYFETNPKSFYKLVLGMYDTISRAKPNAAHTALAGKKVPVITMNIDGLHALAGSRGVIELHGSLRNVHCEKCGKVYPFETVRESVLCPDCGRVLKHDVVLYGDSIPFLYEAMELAQQAEELLVVGTSFYTSTSSYIVEAAKYSGARITLINEDAASRVPEFLNGFSE